MIQLASILSDSQLAQVNDSVNGQSSQATDCIFVATVSIVSILKSISLDLQGSPTAGAIGGVSIGVHTCHEYFE